MLLLMRPPDKKMTGSNPGLARTASGAPANKPFNEMTISGPRPAKATSGAPAIEIRDRNTLLNEILRIAKYSFQIQLKTYEIESGPLQFDWGPFQFRCLHESY